MNFYLNQKYTYFILFLLVNLVVLNSKVIAQDLDSVSLEPISTYRPSISKSASVLPQGTVQAEIGFSYYKDTPSDSELKAHLYPAILLRFGVLNRLEFQLQGSFQDSVVNTPSERRKVKGLGPISVGVAGHILKEEKYIPDVALITTLVLPVGDKEFRPKHVNPSIYLAASKGISQKTSIAMNLGYIWTGGDLGNQLILNLGRDLNDVLSVYIESARNKSKGQNAAYIADAGILWTVMPNLQLDLAAGKQLNDLATDYFITVGIAGRLHK